MKRFFFTIVAIVFYMNATFAQTTYKEWMEMGERDLQAGKYTAAIANFTKAASISPSNADVYMQRGTAKAKNGDDDGAIIDFTQVIRMQPNNGQAYAMRSNSKLRKNDLQGALFDVNKANGIDKTDISFLELRSKVSEKMGLSAQATADAEEIKRLKATDAITATTPELTREGDDDEAVIVKTDPKAKVEKRGTQTKTELKIEEKSENNYNQPEVTVGKVDKKKEAAERKAAEKRAAEERKAAELAAAKQKAAKEVEEKRLAEERKAAELTVAKEEAAARKAAELAAAQKVAEEKAKTEKAEQAAKQKADEQAAKLAAVKRAEQEAKQKADEEAARKAEIETRLKAEALAKQKAAEEEAKLAAAKAEEVRKAAELATAKPTSPTPNDNEIIIVDGVKQYRNGTILGSVQLEPTGGMSTQSQAVGGQPKGDFRGSESKPQVRSEESQSQQKNEKSQQITQNTSKNYTFAPTPAKSDKSAESNPAAAAKPNAQLSAKPINPAPARAPKEEIQRSMFLEARRMANAQNHKGAIEQLNQLLAEDAKNPAALLNRAISKSALQDYEGALKDFEEVQKIAPTMPEIYYNRANVYFDTKRYTDAIESYTDAIEKNKEYVQAYLNRALAKRAVGGAYDPCSDWKAAAALGSEKAKKLLMARCEDQLENNTLMGNK